MARRALISVSDKTGLVEFSRALSGLGWQIIASGGTKKALADAGVAVSSVSSYTGAPEILDGRVKTLHPKIHGGILARDSAEHMSQLREHQIDPIDLVVVNLYPFVKTIAKPEVTWADAIENIDIGGPTLIRAAAKNHERVTVVIDPADYSSLIAALEKNELDNAFRQRMAAKAFAHTAAYDAAIANYFEQSLSPSGETMPQTVRLELQRQATLRYGENPHQRGGFYAVHGARELTAFPYQQLSGQELSYNNILDADAAWSLVQDLPGVAACIIKHTNPCGAASISDGPIESAYALALETDPVSAFGGIVATNRPVTAALAEKLAEIFLEVVIAPDFSADALATLSKKKKLRLLRCAMKDSTQKAWRVRTAFGGVLVQDDDATCETVRDGKVATTRQPTTREWDDLQLAWAVGKHVKSNAIVLVNEGRLLGVGAGQMSRVDSAKLAITKSRGSLQGAVVASDAFFPFRDGLDVLAQAGAKAVVQPGGSVRDEEVIAAANEQGIAMVFTGVRHFRH